MVNNIVEYGNLWLDTEHRSILYRDQSSRITRQQCVILQALALRGGRVVSRSHLRDILWRDRRDIIKSNRLISVNVSNLKKHIVPLKMRITFVPIDGYTLLDGYSLIMGETMAC